jgi:hypothetical protein
VYGVAPASDAGRLDCEMEGVIASFHVEKVPVSITDLEIIEAALSDWQLLNGRGHRKSGDDEVVVYNQCLEDLKSHNRKLVFSDMKAFTAEVDKARTAPNRNVVEGVDTADGPILRKFFSHAFAYIHVGRPTYPENETAVLELSSGPEQHGYRSSLYTLKRKKGKWSIIKRDVFKPV